MRRGLLALLLAAGLLAGCGEESKPAPSGGPASPPATGGATTAVAAGDPERGRRVYLAQCAACHNSDPAKDGPVGPAVKGAARELLEARVLRGGYPEGYKPKRDTKVMPPRPDLAPAIPDLAAYLR